MVSATNWIFTYNNYTPEWEEKIKNLSCRYILFGHEICPTTGTPHLQGCIVFKKRIAKSTFDKMMPICWTHTMDGPVEKSQIYCKKSDLIDVYERGDPPLKGNPGHKSSRNWELARRQAEETGRIEDPCMAMQYYRTAQSMHRDWKKRQKVSLCEITELYTWQQEAVDIILGPVNKRLVYWYVDLDGGKGKTEFANYLEETYDATIILPGKTADLAFMIKDEPKIMCFDFPREVEERVPYSFIEQCKNGRVNSPKYESTQLRFKSPHILVFANFHPDQTKLSADRWCIINL